MRTRGRRAVWTALEVTRWYAIVPLAVASLVTGLVMSLGTSWGLVRHYWVLFRLLLTVLATLVLLGHVPAVSAMAGLTAGSDPGAAIDLRGFDAELLHAGGGLVVLLVTTVLSVFKPRGMTPYGRRKLLARSRGDEAPRCAPAERDAPRSVRRVRAWRRVTRPPG